PRALLDLSYSLVAAYLPSFFLSSACAPCSLPSFPTRRSSDLLLLLVENVLIPSGNAISHLFLTVHLTPLSPFVQYHLYVFHILLQCDAIMQFFLQQLSLKN